MVKPKELESPACHPIWETIAASARGDVAALRGLIERDPRLSRAEYWYTPAVHFAVRDGHTEAVRLLLEAGADPEWNGLHDGSLAVMARDRGHERIAQLLDEACERRRRVVTLPVDHPIHLAAENGDVAAIGALLAAEPSLVNRGDASGLSPLHHAVRIGAGDVITLLLERGADIHARCGAARGLSTGLWHNFEAIDLAIWKLGPERRGASIARLLLERGATYDVTVAAALGDFDAVRQMLDAAPERVRETRPSGRRPLSAAVQFRRDEIVRLLLERGADPTWDEPTAPKGTALHEAARLGNLTVVELLLAHGADPNADVDSAAKAVFLARTPEVRKMLIAYGAAIDPFDAIWGSDDEQVVRQVIEHPDAPQRIASVFTMVCGDGKRALLDRLLRARLRVPPVVTGCQAYLLTHTDMLRNLLAHGMSPDLHNWQHQTLLHLVSSGAAVEQAAMLLEAGATHFASGCPSGPVFTRRCPHLQPAWKDGDRRRNLPSYWRRNQCGLENGRYEVEALNSDESDDRAGV